MLHREESIGTKFKNFEIIKSNEAFCFDLCLVSVLNISAIYYYMALESK